MLSNFLRKHQKALEKLGEKQCDEKWLSCWLFFAPCYALFTFQNCIYSFHCHHHHHRNVSQQQSWVAKLEVLSLEASMHWASEQAINILFVVLYFYPKIWRIIKSNLGSVYMVHWFLRFEKKYPERNASEKNCINLFSSYLLWRSRAKGQGPLDSCVLWDQ